jgi:hypothetical protein
VVDWDHEIVYILSLPQPLYYWAVLGARE